jgi:hypothetical protein
MRRVKIVDEPDKTYAYAAVDQRTGEIPLRHHDRTELIALCRRLEWRIDEAVQDRQASGQRQRQVKRKGEVSPGNVLRNPALSCRN